MSLKKKDPSLRVAANDPHLVSLGGGRLSTAVTIHYIPIGDTTIGSSTACSISLNGSGVRSTHCTIYRSEENEVTIVPEMDARILIDGTKITGETNLTQGAMITIGNSNYLRFNNPAEAQLIRSAMGSNERISMPQIDFTQVQRNSNRSSNSAGNTCRQSIDIETFYESNINPKLEQQTSGDSMINEITKNTVKNEKQQNVTTKKSIGCNGANYNNSVGFDINGWQCPKVFTADLVTVNTPAKDVLGPKYANFARNLAENHRNEKNINNHMTSLKGTSGSAMSAGNNTTPSGFIQNSNSSSSSEFLAKVNNIVHSNAGRTTNANQTSHSNHFHNTIPAYDRYPKPGTYGGLQLFPMNGVNTEINNSSSASSSPSIRNSHNSINSSYETSPNRSHPSFCNRSEQQQLLQKNLSNITMQECERVDEILKMCTEYDRQNQSITSSPIVQNRIKTNGSLPREKKTPFISHDLTSPNNHSTSLPNHQQKIFFPEKSKPPTPIPVPTSSSGYENVRIISERRMEMGSPKIGYENAVVGKYVPQSPRTKIRTTCMSPKKESSFSQSFSHFNHNNNQQQQQQQQQQQKPAHSPNEYEQLIQSFEEKLKMEMAAIEESSKFKPSTLAAENSPVKRSNKNINNLTINLSSDVTINRDSGTSSGNTTKSNLSIALEKGEINLEKLQEIRKDAAKKIQKLKSQITELQKQEDEALREMDLEEALVSAELSSVGDSVDGLEKNLTMLQNKIHRLEAQRNATRVMEENQQAKLKQSIEMKQDQLKKLKTMLRNSPSDECLKEELRNTSDSLDNDRKTFEDLEFQYLEQESEWQAYREELHLESKNLSIKIDEKRIEMHHLEAQEVVTQNNASTDAKSLRDRLFTLLDTLQKSQDELHDIENVICEVTGQLTLDSDENADEDANKTKRSPEVIQIIGVMSQSLFGSAELLCPKRTTDDLMSKSVNENMFFNNKIELPTAQATSTPIRSKLQVVDIIEESDSRRNSLPPIDEVKNPSAMEKSISSEDDKKVSNSLLQSNVSPTESRDRVNFNLTLGNDDFEVNPLEKRIPSQDDIDRISKVTTNAPISTKGASTKIFDSIKEIERNRQLLLAQQGHHVIEHERQKMMDLKKKSHDEARAQYLSMLSCGLDNGSPTNSKSSNTKELQLQSENQQEIQNLEEGNRLTNKENQQSGGIFGENICEDQLPKPSSQNRRSQPELESQRSRPLSEANSEQSCDILSHNTYKSSIELSIGGAGGSNGASNVSATAMNRYSADQSSDDVKRSSLNSNETTSGSERLGSGNKRSFLPKHQRPLTRYLPIFSPDLNLRLHIESAGHQITLCPHVFVDSHSCRGYLHKLGATFRSWARRWFVLDRQRSALIYYSDKSERKPRGGAYFSTIDEVYLDHLNASKSGRPHCTLIVKTKKRSYHLQAASDAAARIWIDAIITGAQGNVEY